MKYKHQHRDRLECRGLCCSSEAFHNLLNKHNQSAGCRSYSLSSVLRHTRTLTTMTTLEGNFFLVTFLPSDI